MSPASDEPPPAIQSPPPPSGGRPGEDPRVVRRHGPIVRELRVGDRTIAQTRWVPSRKESVLVFSLPKAGSVLLDSIVHAMSDQAGLWYFGLEERLFQAGVPIERCPPETSALFLRRGYCYSGFRRLPEAFEIPILDRARKVLLVRDPRDMLVSLYFSLTRSHASPGALAEGDAGSHQERFEADRAGEMAASIDGFVIRRAPVIADIYAGYARILDDPKTLVSRYEDVLYDKAGWARQIREHFSWDVPDDVIERVARAHDTIPDAENPDAHIRRAHPGDHREKLASPTIARLDAILAPVLERHAYAR